MNEQFVLYFTSKYPGMPLDGPTAKDEFRTFTAGYLAGAEDAILVMTGVNGVIGGKQ